MKNTMTRPKYRCKNCRHEHHTIHQQGQCDTPGCTCDNYQSERID